MDDKGNREARSTEPNAPVPPTRTEGMPTWVKSVVAVGAVLLLVVLAVMLFGGGNHGPGRHASIGAPETSPASTLGLNR